MPAVGCVAVGGSYLLLTPTQACRSFMSVCGDGDGLLCRMDHMHSYAPQAVM